MIPALRKGLFFNPHPARRPGVHPEARSFGCALVSILTRPEDRVLRQHPSHWSPSQPFYVSILTRPVDRVLPFSYPRGRILAVLWFQSSPGPKTGCYHVAVSELMTACGFNPHPARTRVCRPTAVGLFGLDVSILTRPEDRVLPAFSLQILFRLGCDVSILTRPEDRVLPRMTARL